MYVSSTGLLVFEPDGSRARNVCSSDTGAITDGLTGADEAAVVAVLAGNATPLLSGRAPPVRPPTVTPAATSTPTVATPARQVATRRRRRIASARRNTPAGPWTGGGSPSAANSSNSFRSRSLVTLHLLC